MIADRKITTRFPTRFGEFTLHGYQHDGVVHLTLVKGDIDAAPSVLMRIHSECLTGDVFGSQRCDCGAQLHAALRMIQQEGKGILIYLRQEGRGIGLWNKLRAYELQDNGFDTVEANLHLGFQPDHRNYTAAIAILKDLGVKSVRLLTNNPEKAWYFEESSVRLIKRIPLQISPNHENVHYLRTKRDRLGHLLDFEK